MSEQASPTHQLGYTRISSPPHSQPRASLPSCCLHLHLQEWAQMLIVWNSSLALAGCDQETKTREQTPQQVDGSHLDLQKNLHPNEQTLHKLPIRKTVSTSSI